jgi:hypothetical protein
MSTLIEQTFETLEELEAQVSKGPTSAGRDRIDLDCGQLRLAEEFESTESAVPPTPPARTNPFLNRMTSVRSGRASMDSSDGMHAAQLSVCSEMGFDKLINLPGPRPPPHCPIRNRGDPNRTRCPRRAAGFSCFPPAVLAQDP